MATMTASRDESRLTIGAVCRALQDDFPDISISKIRYLEDQGLLTPRRTQGGYRLYGEEDFEPDTPMGDSQPTYLTAEQVRTAAAALAPLSGEDLLTGVEPVDLCY